MCAENIGKRIYALIKQQKITAKELAQATDIKESALTGYKKGSHAPSAEALIKISEFFNVTTDWLLTGKESVNMPISDITLSADEAELLELYKRLHDFDKGGILERTRTIVEMRGKSASAPPGTANSTKKAPSSDSTISGEEAATLEADLQNTQTAQAI